MNAKNELLRPKGPVPRSKAQELGTERESGSARERCNWIAGPGSTTNLFNSKIDHFEAVHVVIVDFNYFLHLVR